jgi:hypothetical protein
MPKKVNKKTGKSKQKTTDDQVWVIRKEDFQKALDLLERAIEEPMIPRKRAARGSLKTKRLRGKRKK